MQSIVLVSFAADRQYELKIGDDGRMDQVEAHDWLSGEWHDFGCVPTNPVGKVLLLDKILLVAKFAGEKRFSAPGDWAKRYARAVVAVLGRNTVHVDVAEHVVG